MHSHAGGRVVDRDAGFHKAKRSIEALRTLEMASLLSGKASDQNAVGLMNGRGRPLFLQSAYAWFAFLAPRRHSNAIWSERENQLLARTTLDSVPVSQAY